MALIQCLLRLTLHRTILKGTVVLLPLLGVTWLFGLLTLNSYTTVFAWLFTIFNSLQVHYNFISIGSAKILHENKLDAFNVLMHILLIKLHNM